MFNSENECILFTQGAYQVRGCTNSTDFCNVPLSLTPDAPVLCTPIPEFNITTVFPGEICAKTQECLYGECQENRCTGVLENQSCSSTSECAPGHFCDLTCKPQLFVGDNTCKSDFNCVNWAKCLTVDGATTGVCTEIYSLPVGETVNDCHEGVSQLCAFGSCIGELQGTCIEPLVNIAGYPHICDTDTQCVANVTGTFYEGQCECGFNPTGLAHCRPFIGDSPGVDMITQLKLFKDSGHWSECNSVRRFELECLAATQWNRIYSQKMLKAVFDYVFHPTLYTIPDCLVEVFYSHYWTVINELGSMLLLAPILVFF